MYDFLFKGIKQKDLLFDTHISGFMEVFNFETKSPKNFEKAYLCHIIGLTI